MHATSQRPHLGEGQEAIDMVIHFSTILSTKLDETPLGNKDHKEAPGERMSLLMMLLRDGTARNSQGVSGQEDAFKEWDSMTDSRLSGVLS